jgi:hypothetical protein
MIHLLVGQSLKAAVPLTAILLAQATARFFDEAGIGAAILLTMIGVVLHWHLPQHRTSLEERMKDNKLTDEEARRQLRFYSWCASVATVLGVVVLIAVLFDLTR